MKKLLVSFLLMIFSIVLLPQVFAQTANITVTPSKIDVEGKVGEKVVEKVKVYNKSSNDIEITSYLKDYSIDQKNQYAFFEAGHLPESSASWIEVTPPEFTIKADNVQEVEISINIPSDAFYGTHNSLLFFQTKNPLETNDPGAKVGTLLRVGVQVLTVVKDTTVVLQREGKIDSFDIDVKFKPFIEGVSWSDLINPIKFFSNIKFNFQNLFRPEITSTTVFEAVGNAHINVGGVGKFENSWFGSPFEEDLNSMSVLPNTKREFKSTWENPPILGPSKASINLVYPISLGQENWTKKDESKAFWVIPWTLIYLILFFLAFLYGIWRLIKFLIKRRFFKRDKVSEKHKKELKKELKKSKEKRNEIPEGDKSFWKRK